MAEQPFDQHEGYIWYDGKLEPWGQVRPHVLSHGLHYASSVFEGERVYEGETYKLTEHTERLHLSSQLLGMEIPYSVDEIDVACREVIAANKIIDGYLRPVAWRGSEMMGVSAQKNTIHLAIAVWEWPNYYSPEARMKGLRLQLSKWKRPSPETIPCKAKAAGLYMICTLSKHAAERDGYQDALMLDWRGRVAEATGANVFFIKDGVLHTPTPDCFLDGITRRTVIELAGRRGLEVVERVILPEEMSDFSECFMTGTAVEVTPISEIDNYRFTPGRITETLMNDYSAEVRPSQRSVVAAE
ncbi:Branched-chain amino acid aminotransferase [hydrothermal vent metagenome]|uniref:branched-chain-amino-acid transaminase n=1 Tax=hydrothermal vent metagenome TaxID=652676 RepID=A0A3B0U2B0_9ZZZZ